MPIPTQLLFTFASGLLVALAGRVELRGSPQPTALSQLFAAYLLYAGLVVVPASLYLYVFHGDWYLLYLVDSQRVPSALVLLGCVVEVGLGAAGFMLGARLIRNQREPLVGALIGITASLGGAAIPLVQSRLAVVGSYAQFHGDFGLAPFGGALLQGVVGMTLWCLVGLALLSYRVGLGTSRS